MARRPTWKKLESSNLNKVWYDRKRKILHVVFHSGHYYVYGNVSYYRYWMLRQADSKGRYFVKHIRNKYKYRRIQ